MVNLFPYNLVPKGSKIVLYGGGALGRDFYLQIHLLGDYYKLVGWADRGFDLWDVKHPFCHTKDVVNTEFDFLIICLADENVANNVKSDWIARGVSAEKIIWSKQFFLNRDFLPMNKKLFLGDLDFYMDILDEYQKSATIFGSEMFYQSYEELGIKGRRSSGDRIALYHIRDYLDKNDECLDIGCNTGFLSMQIAPYVKRLMGYDVEPHYIAVAEKVKKFMGITNIEFYCEDFRESAVNKKYDAIFSFAVYAPLLTDGFTKENFVDLMYRLLKPKGYLFFESNSNEYKVYPELCDMFLDKGMEMKMQQNYVTDFDRTISILRK